MEKSVHLSKKKILKFAEEIYSSKNITIKLIEVLKVGKALKILKARDIIRQ